MKAAKFISLAIILLLAPLVYIRIRMEGMTYANWLLLPASIIWLFLLSLWYLGFGKPPLKKRLLRFGIGIVCFFALAFGLSRLLRYEGSTSGSSFPKFSWVWEDNETATVEVSSPGSGTEINLEELESAAADLNQIFGPDRNATWTEAAFNVDWSSDVPEEIWRRPVGAGWSSFAVAGNQAVTHEQIDDDETITCFNLFTGEVLWRYQDEGVRLLLAKADQPGAAMGGEGPRSTPTIHDGKIYALGSTGILNCLDLETGEKIWSRNVLEEFEGVIHDWGMANSPLVLPTQGTVILPASKDAGVNLVAFDLKTGEDVWTYEGKGASYSSPRVLDFFGTTMIVSVNGKDVTGHDPATGKVIWSYDWPGNFPRVGQPMKIGDDRLLLTASYGMGTPLLQLAKSGDEWSVERLWSSNRLKTKFSSAAIIGDHAFGLDEGRLACISLEDGRIVWKGEKYGFGQHLLFGDHLLIQTERGPVVIGQLTPEGFTETGRIDEALSSMTWNAPAIAGRLLLIRNDQEAICYLLPSS